MNFGEALKILKDGGKVSRENWNGKGMFLELQRPTELSKMTQPYIYINIPKGNGGYNYKDLELVPWLASQSDMLSEDWLELK